MIILRYDIWRHRSTFADATKAISSSQDSTISPTEHGQQISLSNLPSQQQQQMRHHQHSQLYHLTQQQQNQPTQQPQQSHQNHLQQQEDEQSSLQPHLGGHQMQRQNNHNQQQKQQDHMAYHEQQMSIFPGGQIPCNQVAYENRVSSKYWVSAPKTYYLGFAIEIVLCPVYYRMVTNN
ncbi:unnamed protein product [Protopolystoma xenopodis]|uniref:Uncharacterized protein n=1 Tax=Protopolystoma xenopodis TaxID=117903 RepID=A0A3S5CRR6_9PLAT|nr:unnamed protein product [Protopolystoma xenopodis]